jgi:hypothetical protein
MTPATVEAPKTVSRAELYELIWTEPMTKVAPRFGLSDVGLAKVCKRCNIPRPPVGYWAQKQVGKEPERAPLPKARDATDDLIEFSMEEKPKPVEVSSEANRGGDPELNRLIQFEEKPENRITVEEGPARYHGLVRSTRDSMKDSGWHRQGLLSPTWREREARLDIEVSKESLPRALRLMDAILKAFEKRGHKLVSEAKEYHCNVFFTILGEQFSFRLREKSKMIRIPESEQKKDHFSNRVRYEPTGDFELQLRRKQSSYPQEIWKDSKRRRLEDQLNEVMIALIVGVEKERNWRIQQEENERQRRADEAKRWQQEQERRKEEQKISELTKMVGNWNQAASIREFIADVKATIKQRQGPIEEGSELATWMEWAINYAKKLDPLGAKTEPEPASGFSGFSRPSQPR